jgi:CubicO group peptidase (beta-lactamase class C family)
VNGPVDAIDQVIEEAIRARVFPGAVVLVTREGSVHKQAAYGHAVLYQNVKEQRPDPLPTTTATIYDLASLTKVVATTTAIMQLVEAGRVDLDAPAWTYLPGFGRTGKRAVTVRHLLTHTSGLPAVRLFYKRLQGQSEIVDAVERTRLVGRPGAQVLYSDLGFIALGALVTAVAGEALEAYTSAHVCAPLGMRDTLYRPPPALRARIAATEDQPLRGLVWGEVHDENAQAMGGVSGHAGLFGTAADLGVFCTTLLAGGSRGGARRWQPATLQEMFTVQTGALSPAHGLGWRCNEPSFMGALASPRTFGHTGFTGTSIVLDLERRLSVILLTNRVHPTRHGPDLAPVRAAVATCAQNLM